MAFSSKRFTAFLLAVPFPAGPVSGADVTSHSSIPDKPEFDIQKASVTRDGNELIFAMEVAADAGGERPAAIGQLKGSTVYSYVWPTSLGSGPINLH